jgi:hypothetical protein
VKTFQMIGVIIAGTGLATVLVAPGAKTASVVSSFFGGLGEWTKKSQGRG